MFPPIDMALIPFLLLPSLPALYLLHGYWSLRPRTWVFDQRRREAQLDGVTRYPFERLIRVEVDREKMRGNRDAMYTRFVLTLCWMAGPERAVAARTVSRISGIADEIAGCVGVPVVHLEDGREL